MHANVAEYIYWLSTIEDLAKDIYKITLLPSSNKRLTHTAGQYVEFILPNKERCLLSIANRSLNNHALTFVHALKNVIPTNYSSNS